MTNLSQKFNFHFSDIVNSKSHKAMTIGVEQEFFVTTQSGNFANLSQTQTLFEMISGHKEIKIKSRINNLIKSIGQDNENGSYNSIKYEFPPHMLEVSFGYFSNLFDLEKVVSFLMNTLDKSANELGLIINHVPFIEELILDDISLKKLDHIQHKLMINREQLAKKKGILDHMITQFPACVASTQYHIGGLDWFNNSKIIDSLYAIEPYISYMAHVEVAKINNLDLQTLLNKRWDGYLQLFGENELFGFPKFEHWDFESWKNIYLKDKKDENENIVDLIKRSRDLLFIKPRYIGTLEFRSTPALSNTASILKFAAYRFAQGLLAKNNFNSDQPITKSSDIWRDIFKNPDKYLTNIEILKELSYQVLKGRNLGEEKFLQSF